MQEQLISFDTASLAKEKGFNVPTQSFWYRLVDKEGNQLHCSPHHVIDDKLYVYVIEEGHMDNPCICSTPIGAENTELDTFYLAPTQSLLQKWLREVHKIDVTPINCTQYPLDKELMERGYGGNIYHITKDENLTGYFGKTYEAALEEGLKQGLKLIP